MFKARIETGNGAFHSEYGDRYSEREARNAEVARILREIADQLEHGYKDGGRCIDYNGNVVGEWHINNR